MNPPIKMKAALITEFMAPIRVVDNVEIDAPRDGEVLVKVSHVGLCSTDLSIYGGGDPNYPLPALVGHEATGIVHEVGGDVANCQVGNRVVLSMGFPCGACGECAKGSPQTCDNVGVAGRPRIKWQGKGVFPAFGLGAFAEYALVKAENVVVIPDDTPGEFAALVGCAVQTGIGAVNNVAQMPAGSSCLVNGAGSVGICVIQAAAAAGAKIIIAIDPNLDRREAALKLGATHAFASDDDDLLNKIYQTVQGPGVDYGFDLVGIPAVTELTVSATRPGGKAVLIGVKLPDMAANIPTMQIVLQAKKIEGCYLGNCNAAEEIPIFLKMWKDGKFNIDALITARRPIEEINEAFADLIAGKGLRTVLNVD